ncbi:MAG: epoxyqueuosine reductase [Ruminococcaceae bacterium]|nr:epoxyqueuosine reductase [Oscillospiraceae bacterium]
MDLCARLKSMLAKYNIADAAAVRLSDCKIILERKLDACGFSADRDIFAYVFTVPYFVNADKTNISAYAKSKDYHIFFSELFSEIVPQLQKEFPEYKFAGFADSSPIDEVHAAALAGLGIIGKNGLLITPKYSSYVFIGELITDFPIQVTQKNAISFCKNCGICKAACPKKDIGICLSALTQEKGLLTEEQQNHIKKYSSAWGCDICQECCPHTLAAIANNTIYTPIDFFKTDRTEDLSIQLVEGMSDKEFSARAYSWRKKETVLRNLSLTESKKKGGQA